MKPLFTAILLPLLMMSGLWARDIHPLFRLKSSGLVTDFVIDGFRLYASNDMGSVDVFDLNTRKIVEQIVIEPIFDFKGDPIPPRIYSVDRLNGKTLFVSTGKEGFRNVWIHDGKRLKQIIRAEEKLFVKEARFIDDERVMLGTVGYEMILYDMGERYRAYSRHVAQSAFGDVALSEDKSIMATSAESGEVTVSDVKTSKVLRVLSSENVDNVYRVAYSNGVVITAGQDRRVGVYFQNGDAYHIKSDFLVYSAALSPSGAIGIYSSGVENDLQVFDVKTRQKTHRLTGHYATPTAIKFVNEKELFSAGDENDIFFWRLD